MASMEEKVAQLECKLEMMEIVRRNERKEWEEKMNRMSQEIRTYSSDILRAKDIPMTATMGEILMDEIMNVFEVLAKYGIKLD